MGARVVAGCPHSVELPLQELLVGLGVASGIFWSARAATGGPEDRYWRVLAADTGFMCVGVGLGTAHGLEAALLLVLAHWLGGAVLGRESGQTRGIEVYRSAAADHLTLWRELLGLLVAAATLLLGLVPSQALGVVMGLHP